MGCQNCKLVYADTNVTNDIRENIYTEPYSYGYNVPYSDTEIQEQVINTANRPRNTSERQTREYQEYQTDLNGIQNDGYIDEDTSSAGVMSAIPTLDLIFIVQNDEKDRRNCTLHNNKIFRLYLNKFSIESRKIDIQFQSPIFVDRNLDFVGTNKFIHDELEKRQSKFVEKVQDGSEILYHDLINL